MNNGQANYVPAVSRGDDDRCPVCGMRDGLHNPVCPGLPIGIGERVETWHVAGKAIQVALSRDSEGFGRVRQL